MAAAATVVAGDTIVVAGGLLAGVVIQLLQMHACAACGPRNTH